MKFRNPFSPRKVQEQPTSVDFDYAHSKNRRRLPASTLAIDIATGRVTDPEVIEGRYRSFNPGKPQDQIHEEALQFTRLIHEIVQEQEANNPPG